MEHACTTNKRKKKKKTKARLFFVLVHFCGAFLFVGCKAFFAMFRKGQNRLVKLYFIYEWVIFRLDLISHLKFNISLSNK